MNYDDYLAQKTDKYITPCKPEKETKDEDYNCHFCDNIECKHWGEFNDN